MKHHEQETIEERQRQCPQEGWRRELYIIIFEADTPAGRLFDVGLLIAILAGIAVISLETVPALANYGGTFRMLEWVVTALFTIEYVLRLACVRNPLRYAFSFWGVIDLCAILPTYITVLGGAELGSLAMVRAIRLLRVFRVLKLLRLMSEAEELYRSVWDSRDKIVVFLFTVVIAVTLSGTLMYEVESSADHESKFSSIPQSMYWAIVTMTTVGYGDVVPETPIGKIISTMLILLGYSIIIVPTGFVTAKLSQSAASGTTGTSEKMPVCKFCGSQQFDRLANYCSRCGEEMH